LGAEQASRIGLDHGRQNSGRPAAQAKAVFSPFVSQQSRVSAMVLNYNGRALLEVILPSLARQTYADLDVVVIDDASSDTSRDYVATEFPSVTFLSTGPRNVGVSAALNVAVGAATGELVALLNNDLELEADWLEQLVAGIDRHPEAGSVAGKTLNYWRRHELDGAGDVFTLSATAHRRGVGGPDNGQYEREEEVFAPSAGAALYRAAALADVGPFDESFMAYLEDVDWGLRAQLAGYRAWYVPTAVAFHMGSKTTGGDTSALYYGLLRRNTIAILVKDVPFRFIARNLVRIAGHHVIGLVQSARRRRLGVHLRAFADAARHLPGWWRARRVIFATRRISVREFDRFVTPPRERSGSATTSIQPPPTHG
jgi:GT2 family glycosyltransferase